MKSFLDQIISIFTGEDTTENASTRAVDGSQTKAISKGKQSPNSKGTNLYTKVKKAITCERKKALNSKIKENKSSQESTQFSTPDRRVIKELLDFVELRHTSEDLICPICLKFIAHANCLTCGHTYCEMCISELSLISKDCLVCEKPIKKNREFGKCRNVDSLVENVLSTMSMQEELMDLHKRKHEVL